MGMIKGDKSRYNRERRKKLARRVEMRALRATLTAPASATAQPNAATTQPASRRARSAPASNAETE